MKRLEIIVMLLLALAGFIAGWSIGRKSVKNPEPVIIEKIDTIKITDPPAQAEWVKTKITRLPAVNIPKLVVIDDHDIDSEPIDSEPIDSVSVEVPIYRYTAHKDSLYHIEATGYDVEFESIEVYPKTITEERYIETVMPMRWGIGIQAGYGATICDKSVKLAPYVGVGISYNILAF